MKKVNEIIGDSFYPGDGKGSTGVSVFDGPGKRIFEYHISERDLFCALCNKRGGGQLQSQQRTFCILGTISGIFS